MRVSIGLLVACVFAGCNVAPTPAGTASHLTPPAEAARPVAVADARPAVDTPAADAARAAATADSAPAAPAPAVAPVEVRYREITIPAGTSLSLALTSGVSSKTSSVEDAVSATLRRAIVVDGVTVVPAGAAVGGHVTEAERSGKVKGRARIGVRFTSLRANGERYDIRTASIAREAPRHQEEGRREDRRRRRGWRDRGCDRGRQEGRGDWQRRRRRRRHGRRAGHARRGSRAWPRAPWCPRV